MNTSELQMALHAQQMASLCTAPYSQLVMQVVVRHPQSEELQRKLIGMISHANQMARICSTADAHEMIYGVAEKLFATASCTSFTFQEEGTRLIVAMISHSTCMSRIEPEGAAEIYGMMLPIAKDALPADQQQLEHLRTRLDDVRISISDLVHRIQMEKLTRQL